MKTIIYALILMLFCKNSIALSGECIDTIAIGETAYYNSVSMNICKIDNQYFLKNEFLQIYVWDQADRTSCSDPFNKIPAQYNTTFENLEIQSTTFWVAEQTYHYFAQNFNWFGLDGIGSAINLLILNRDDFGYCPEYKRIFIGKDSQATIDIIAHEIFHGISHAAVGLDNSMESSAIKESFSDIFGEVMENQLLSTNDWLVNALPGDSTTALRSLKAPHQFEGAKFYKEDPYWEDDYGGQYQNAGVQNHWFYLLSTGNEYMEGIGIHQAAQIVFKTIRHYLLPKASYKDVRDGTIQAAKDIFGTNSTEQAKVALAWNEVGVFDLNNCVDSYIITGTDDFNFMPLICNFINTSGDIIVPQHAQISLTAGNWIGINSGFEIPKTALFTLKIN